MRRSTFRTVVVVLHTRDVRHSEIVTVPSLESIHAEQPETRAHVGERDEAVVVPNVDAERALLHAYGALPAVVRRAPEDGLVHAILARKIVAVGLPSLR